MPTKQTQINNSELRPYDFFFKKVFCYEVGTKYFDFRKKPLGHLI